jgi:coatomer protein complex subunit gamma
MQHIFTFSCLSKDMTSTTDMYRANAIRVMAKVMDVTMFNSIDRFLKQAIVDKVASEK